MMHVLPCSRVRESLEAYVDGELTLNEQVSIQNHLQECVACRLEASELAEIGCALRAVPAATAALPHETGRLTSIVLERVRLEQQFSFGVKIRSLFDDMHLVWAGLGATVAMIICIFASAGVLQAASDQRPDSLAGLIDYLANPGSNANPVRLDTYMSLPRGYEPVMPTTTGDAELTVAAVVTREGRVQNLELIHEQARALHVKPEVVLAMLDAAAQARFVPARKAGGSPVAVSMVWLLSSTTVKGRPDYDMYLLRPPAQAVPVSGPIAPVKPRPIAAPAPAPAKVVAPTGDADAASVGL